jgi:hypothetical protein
VVDLILNRESKNIKELKTVTSYSVEMVTYRNRFRVAMMKLPLLQLERRDVAASQTLRAALLKVEAAHPGFTHDLVVGIMRRGDLSINMNESVLRLQGTTSEPDSELHTAYFYFFLPFVCTAMFPFTLLLDFSIRRGEGSESRI